MIYIENEDALFRGYVVFRPLEIWSKKQKKFVPYEGEVPKPHMWGNVITEQEAKEWMV